MGLWFFRFAVVKMRGVIAKFDSLYPHRAMGNAHSNIVNMMRRGCAVTTRK